MLPLSSTHELSTQDDSNYGKEVMYNFNVSSLVCNAKVKYYKSYKVVYYHCQAHMNCLRRMIQTKEKK